MATTEAQRKAIKKWQEKTDEIRFRVPKGDKERLTAHAAQFGESLTAFLNRAAAEAVERDNQNKNAQNQATALDLVLGCFF